MNINQSLKKHIKMKKKHEQLADYHNDVILHQKDSKRLLSKKEKQRLFKISKIK